MRIKVRNVSKKFSGSYVLHNVNLTFDGGKFYGIIGPNGAGKSTLINIIIGNISADGGNCDWIHDDNKLSKLEVKNALGVVFQENHLDPLLTVYENLMSRGKMYGMSKKNINDRINFLNDYIDIESILKQRYAVLSGGQKRKCEVVRSLLHDPKVLILDEPTTGLDPQTRSGMWQAISRFHDENKLTVILVTHYLEEMSDCDQISVVLKGNVRYTGDVEQFIKDHSETQLSITLNDLSAVQTVLKRLDGKYQYSKDLKDARLTVSIQDPSEMIDLLTEIKKIAQVKDFQVYHATLERAYLNLLDDEGVAIEGGKTNAGLN
ncbi:MAG: ABC transporter ATP-binding protein [Bombilactobacillus mellis]|uniref:ABC transporter ATP-binding protein n=2 Tax=Bombilactobacillus mellifer TaxID=1218492 RepID=UPI0023F4ED3E|nr:ABC transporter ATP-binding protein [Bombilactobacillus mellifer]MCT6826765.1 ABC transporter ATP-binding protein [Bombilactobacillus mellifer]MCT6856514.1 ABC transporter ATP-binding protein [Bombilactobacillus mellis]